MIELLFQATISFKRIRECSSEAEMVNVLQLVEGENSPHTNALEGGPKEDPPSLESRRVGTVLLNN